MWKKDNIQHELQVVSPGIAAIQKQNVFSVPPLYFINFASQVLTKIRLMEGADSAEIKSTQLSAPPAGFFEGFAASVMSKINAAAHNDEISVELKFIAPTLAGLSRTNVYTVPTGYFGNLEPRRSEKVEAKVIPLYRTTRVLQYLAAAVIIAVMAISAYIFLDKRPSASLTEVQPVTSPLKLDVVEAVENLSDEEIANYLQKHTAGGDSFSGYVIPDTEDDFDEIINNLSEEELQNFLKQYPETNTKSLNNS